MENYLTQITNYLLTQSWQIAVLVVVIAAVNLALKNKSAHVRYLLWLIVLAKCLVPPLFTMPVAVLPQERPIPLLETPPVIISEPSTSTPASDASTPTRAPRRRIKPVRTLTSHQWLGFGWVVGVAAFAIVAATKALRTNFCLWRQRKPLPQELHRTIEEAFSNYGRLPSFWLVEGIGQPFVWGLLRGSIYLPADFVKVNNSEHRRGVLGHELSHILRFDAAVNILQIIAQAVFWFHPFVWWANKKIRAEREKCCDEMAIARLNAKVKDYSSAIVNILISEHESTRPVPSLAVAGPVKNIEERIKTMLRPGKKFYKRPSIIAATVVLLLALLTVPTALVLTARSEEAATEPEPILTKSLQEAAKDGDIEQVKKLIAQGADIDEKGKYGRNALHAACCYKGRSAIIRLLIDHGANVNARDVAESTPLHFAARYADKQTVELLLTKGADVNAKNKKKGRTPLFEAMTSPIAGRKEVVELLVAKGAKVSAFHLAAYMGDMGKLEKYLQEGINVNTPGEFNNTALHAASNSGKKNIVEFLISKGALVDAKDAFSMTPLFYAACNNYQDIVDLLLAEGADVSAKDKRGYTLLYYAVWLANKNAITLLIDKGANVNVKDVFGYTPLHLVTIQGKKEITELLIELLIVKGADVNAVDNEGRTPLWHAKDKGRTEIVELLRKHGARE